MQTQTVVLNVAPGGVPPIVYATQNDNGRTVHISVIDGASGYSLSDSYTYVICGTKPSGTGFSYDDKVTKIGSSMLSFDVNTVMTAVAGPVRCGIIIYNGDQHVETLAFILQVQESALSPETIIDSNDFQSIIESAVRDYIEEAGLVVDDTLSVAGAAADAKKTGDEINDLKSAIDLGSVTPALKTALLQLASKVAYIDDDGQDYYDDLYDALYNRYWEVTNNLTNCTTSNESVQTIKGAAYTATITASTGYFLTGATVSITMGGNDITATAYSNGVISIPAVTGALVITISAAAKTVSSISAVYTQSGTVYDTDTLDSLKDDLVVTATYDDSSTAVVPAEDYTLSGTLTAGTSTITVNDGGKTATFDVIVATPITSTGAFGTANYVTWDTANNQITFSGRGTSNYPGAWVTELSFLVPQVLTKTFHIEFDYTLSGYSSGVGLITAIGAYISASPANNGSDRKANSTVGTFITTNGTGHFVASIDLSTLTWTSVDSYYFGVGIMINANSGCSCTISNIKFGVVDN